MSLKIILVRHGQTDYNKNRILQGRTDIPLNETGIEQAYKTKELLEDEKIDLMYVSPLTRTKQTAEILNEKRNCKIIYDERLLERDFGEYEKVPIKEYNIDEFWSYKLNKKYKSAENIRDLLNRVSGFIEDIKEKYDNKTILVVAHAGVSVGFECYFNGIPKDDKLVEIRLKNCEARKYEIL